MAVTLGVAYIIKEILFQYSKPSLDSAKEMN
jgi:hypothetical protein